MPPTLDATLDALSERLGVPMPVADYLYSSPYNALMSADTAGGYVGRETLDGVRVVHLAFTHPKVDWELWLPETGDPLPKKLIVTAKAVEGRPSAQVVFSDWNLSPEIPADRFTPSIPAGYERLDVAIFGDQGAQK